VQDLQVAIEPYVAQRAWCSQVRCVPVTARSSPGIEVVAAQARLCRERNERAGGVRERTGSCGHAPRHRLPDRRLHNGICGARL
jgi:hypothetical protein